MFGLRLLSQALRLSLLLNIIYLFDLFVKYWLFSVFEYKNTPFRGYFGSE